jgi:hypothetical protein
VITYIHRKNQELEPRTGLFGIITPSLGWAFRIELEKDEGHLQKAGESRLQRQGSEVAGICGVLDEEPPGRSAI